MGKDGANSQAIEEVKKNIALVTTKIGRQDIALYHFKPPAHFKKPASPIGKAVFSTLCLMSFGHASMEPIWASIILHEAGDESVWEMGLSQLMERLQNINVVAGLLLATASVFITTEPPNATVTNYIIRGPYLCFIAAAGLLLGSIIVGSATLLVMGKTRPRWAKEVHFANRFHLYCTLIIVSYPFYVNGVATLVLAFGILTSMWCAKDPLVQGSAVFFLLFPVSTAVMFAISATVAARRMEMEQNKSEG